MNAYIKQYARAERYLERMRKIYEGVYLPGTEEAYEDEIISFFIHCYHIRDWILQLLKSPISKADIDHFINSHNELKICADLCNGEKHCVLKWNRRTGGQPNIAYRAYSVSHFTPASGVSSCYKASYRILSGAETYDALELAEACMLLWEDYISRLAVNVAAD